MADKCILVLGMHRSGTSAFTGLLCHFGVFAGEDLLPANDANPRGYFESKAVVDLNNAILQAAGSSWDDMMALPVDWHRMPSMQPLREAIATLLLSPAVEGGLRVIKDPRLSKTLPLWRDVLAECGIQPVVVVCVREPAAVAQSEKLMKGFPVLKSLLLYLEYGFQAEFNSRQLLRSIVAYSDLLADWQGVLKRVEAELGLGLLLNVATPHTQGDGFISPELNRSRLDADEFHRCGTLAEMTNELYQAMLSPVADELDILRQRFMTYQRDIQPWSVVLQHVQALEERFLNVDLGPRFGFSRVQSRLAWADTLMADFDSANSVTCKWMYGSGLHTIRIAFVQPCVAQKFRLNIVNRPAYVRVHSLELQQGDIVLNRWEHLQASLIGQSDSAFELSVRTNGSGDAWLFLHGKCYLDIKLPDNQQVHLDQRCCLVLNIEVSPISAAVQPLLARLGQLQKEASKQRQWIKGQDSRPAEGKPLVSLAADLADLHDLLLHVLENRDQRITAQQHTLEGIRNELLRAEAQLDFLKDVLIGHMDADGRL